MCLPGCTIELAEAASRRSFLRKLSISACAAAFSANAADSDAAPPKADEPRYSFQRVVDLTHTLSAHFPMPWQNAFEMEQLSKLGKDKWNIYRWHLHEHIGTHIDAPFHCTDGITAEKIPAEQLVGPLVVVDIREKAAANSDAQLTLDELKNWERKNGPIPLGAIVALWSGWDAKVNDASKFLGLDDKGHFHLPGFHLEAVQFLHQERGVKGIATDTINLDPASAGDFPVHHYWLGQGKWGLENVANLGQLPAKGATLVVGAPKIAGCSGGPSRVLALV